MNEHQQKRGGMFGALRSVGRATIETYRLGGRLMVEAPSLLLIAVVPELLQHVVEIQIGMFASIERFRALSTDPLRLAFGWVKIAGIVIAMLMAARFWAMGTVRRTLLVPPSALMRVAAGTLAGVAVLLPIAWLVARSPANLASIPLLTLQLLSALVQGAVLIFIVGALLEDRSVTLRRTVTSLLPTTVILFLLVMLAYAPLQALHMATHQLALGRSAFAVWVIMTFDALAIGLLASLMGSALFVGLWTALTWKGWIVLPKDIA